MTVRILLCAVMLAALAACGPDYSPNTYSSAAVQQANNVDQGVVVGVRRVGVSADTTVGSVTGAAAGGIAGSQVGGGVTGALGALGGGLLGGIAGSAAQHVEGDAQAYEYIVRKTKGDLVSVTQSDKVPLRIGEHVLVIAGKQARIVPDYTVPEDVPKTVVVAAPPPVPMPSVPAAASVPPVPEPAVPVQAVPVQAVPEQTAPVQTAPVQAGPVQAGPGSAPTPLAPPTAGPSAPAPAQTQSP